MVNTGWEICFHGSVYSQVLNKTGLPWVLEFGIDQQAYYSVWILLLSVATSAPFSYSNGLHLYTTQTTLDATPAFTHSHTPVAVITLQGATCRSDKCTHTLMAQHPKDFWVSLHVDCSEETTDRWTTTWATAALLVSCTHGHFRGLTCYFLFHRFKDNAHDNTWWP